MKKFTRQLSRSNMTGTSSSQPSQFLAHRPNMTRIASSQNLVGNKGAPMGKTMGNAYSTSAL